MNRTPSRDGSTDDGRTPGPVKARPGRPPGRVGDETRQAVRHAAARVFLRKGYRDTAIQDIADELGIAKGSAYHYIRSKPEVLYDIVSDGMQGLVDRLTLIVDYPLSATDRLRLALRDNLRSTVEDVHAPVAIALKQELSYLSDEHQTAYKDLRLRYQELWFRLYDEGVQSGEFRDIPDAKLVWFGIFGMLSYFQQWFSKEGERSLNEVADIWLDLIVNGIAAPSPEAERVTGTRKKRTA